MSSQGGESIWQSVSDMMTALMLIFLFISIIFMKRVESKQKATEEALNAYMEAKSTINDALNVALGNELEKMGAEITADNAVKFSKESLMFEAGTAKISPSFKNYLENFFPKYIEQLYEFKDDVDEIRIEGHTSSDWTPGASYTERYLRNLALSQARAEAILDYTFKMKSMEKYRPWLVEKMRAVGMAFAKPIYDAKGNEDKKKSKRVEFRVETSAEETLDKIGESLKPAPKQSKEVEEKEIEKTDSATPVATSSATITQPTSKKSTN